MISDKMENALNEQIREEMFSSYLYLAMSASMQNKSLPGYANWFRVQAQEELSHAMKIYGFIEERGGRVELLAIDKPQVDWETPLAAFEAAYKHEVHISDCFNNLAQLAVDTRDFATQNFLQWFVNEQVEEEASADEAVQKLKLVAGAPGGVFMLDRELGARVFTPPEAE